ncbi:MAG TPA: UDP-forming cellulose synthase catalytic subunit [Rhodopila sp.]|uniref:UDP-forming cellulose synthase catalytic subunit n=1 Tax=Rhodopila sp. TaxID=2480087 RepID=UPI002C43D171|nr:UDP-forming cellulose synthase catalytic subunit [Rhodopila sp.]HVY13837.1 UDP-forming cellulose synthase catalytic subunit [Rhodopila sp.]
MKRFLHRLTMAEADTPRGIHWLVVASFGVVGIALALAAATSIVRPIDQAVLAVITAAVFLVCNRRPGRGMTLFLTMLSAVVSLRYIVWRFTETLEFNTVLQGVLGTGLALAEAYAILVLALGYIQTVWPLDRKPLPLPEDPADWPSVDIYVPTYNEDLSIVRATVLAAMAVDWPPDKLKVYILDDGRRRAFRDFAASCGAGYIIRPDNNHAKAGNLNHAMKVTDGEFVAVFDCDHVPTRAFLQMTMGWLVHDKRMAFIQTPHHFYSPDPFQRNLAAGTRVPAEGNLFYGLIQDGNDFWNASFFCGSCAVIRRAALQTIGGFATETVTEDAHTALKLHRKGWQSCYLRLPLAAGLATERLILHIGQRVRWARGMLQILRLDNPVFGRGLTVGQRICYVNAMMHFMFAVPRVVFLTSPLCFLLLGQNIIAASPLAIIAYALPHIFHSVATNARIQGNWRHSFWSEIYETVLALFLVRITVVTMVSPRRGRFNVTDKGGLLSKGYFDMGAVYPNLILAGVLGIGLLRGLYGLLLVHTTRLEFQAYLLNSVWVSLSLLIVLAALAVGRETRQIRNRARITTRLPVVVWLPDGRTLAATSRNLSLGGAAFALERPDELRLPLPVDIEFALSGERMILPAKIERWEERLLQVSWEARTIAEESRVIRVVFGRADAWVDWSNYPLDRPLRSLWTVLVSIRGLFRRRGQALSSGDLPAPATAPVGAASGTLGRQTMVLRPRPGALIAGALLCLLATRASAQGPAAQPIPSVPLPPVTGAPASNPPPGGVASPAGNAGQGAQPNGSPGAAQAPFGGSAAPFQLPSGAQGSTRTEVFTLRQLGALGPMTMRGTSTIQGLQFGIARDEVVTEAHLSLSGAMSPSLIPDVSNVTVTLNEQYVGTIPVTASKPEFGPLEMSINPVFFQDRNRLNFRFTGRYTQDCNDPLSGLLWSTISDRSTLTLTIARLPPRRDLARLPRPFFDENIRQKLSLPFILADNSSNEALEAAAITASWFGKLADFRTAQFPVTREPPQDGNAVLIVVGHEMPAGIALPAPQGPLIAEVPNPNDPLGTILVIAGRTGAEAIAAADTLSRGSRILSGSSTSATLDALPPRKPYDAPDWITTDRPVRFGELVDASTLQGTGYVPGTFHVPFHTAPDLYTWRRRPFKAMIRFRAPPGPVVDVAASRLDVSINGIFLHSYSLAPPDRIWDWVEHELGMTPQVRRGATAIPLYDVFGQNDLQLYFDARPLHRGDCTAIPEDLHLAVDPDSTIDLSSAYHFTQLPNLAFFVSAGFPFTRMADLSDTAVVLPQQPNTVELTAFLDLMGNIAALTGLPVNRVSVLRPSEANAISNKDILLIGTLSRLGPAADLLRRSPYKVEGNSLRVELPTMLSGIWRLFGDNTETERNRAGAALAAPLGEQSAVMIGAQAPNSSDRSLVAILGGSPQALNSMVDAMNDPKLVPHIQGDLAILSGGQMTSYRAGSTYTVGYLPFWLWPEWWLEDRPGAIIAAMIIAASALGICLHRLVRWRASRRSRHPGATKG